MKPNHKKQQSKITQQTIIDRIWEIANDPNIETAQQLKALTSLHGLLDDTAGEQAQPLQIAFNVMPPKSEVKITRGK